MTTDAKREAVHRKIDLFLERLTNGDAEQLKPYLYEVIDIVLDETQALQQRKAESSDLRELIIEMREGFKRMDARFEQMEKRFEQVERRFEQIDKRFEELMHYTEKRFEQMDRRFADLIHYVDKRFEQVDKRFEAIDARINRLYRFLVWMLGVIATGFLGLYIKLFFGQ